MTLYKVGIDIGSTTAKIVALDPSGKPVYTNYVRHQARVKDCIADFCSDLRRVAGDSLLSISVTGSVGMGVSERCNVPFVQEVVAAANYVRCAHPEAKTMIDIGGEDAKVVFFDGGRAIDLRMNGNCAGGTGAFIDQMAILLHASNDELNALALRSTQVYPMASRCGVFSKTDIQNLIARNVPREDIAASIFHAVAVQTVTTLAHGCVITPPVMFCGGPLTFLSGLRKAFSDYLGFAENEIVLPENGSIIPAWGAALAENGMQTSAREFEQLVSSALSLKVHSYLSLPPIFEGKEDYEHWRKNLGGNALRRVAPGKGNQEAFIGIDSGSTTTKVVALSPEGNLLFSYYHNNDGDPIGTVEKGLELLKKECEKHETNLKISGSCSTGYGEDLIRAAFGLGGGIIETIAHYLAAKNISPEVSFILDIGGQDMKAIFVDHGVINRIEINEACSSGCGSFISTFARSLDYDVNDFARAACTSDAPCDLGTRCTVFMNSKVKQVLREGATVADIAAGLSYSVVKNCLYKVLQLKNTSELGKYVVVQGGTMRNDSIVRALEKLASTHVNRSDCPELMGAVGCALYAMEHKSDEATEAGSVEEMLSRAKYTTRRTRCKGCENQCTVTHYLFPGNRKYYSGNRCERVFSNRGTKAKPGRNVYPQKYRLLFNRECKVEKPVFTIGIPRCLNIYEDYPFWHTFLNSCGIRTVLSSESSYADYERNANCVMSDNICFPAKLVHSHIADLERKGVDRIFMPFVVFERKEKGQQNSYNCPIVSGYSEVVNSSQSPKVPVESPVVTFKNRKLLQKQMEEWLSRFGIASKTVRSALSAAEEAEKQYRERLAGINREVLEEARREKRLAILLAGRPYHTDPLIQHRVAEMATAMGVYVITDDIVYDEKLSIDDTIYLSQWAYPNRILKAAKWAGLQPADVQYMQLTSFGCGPDAFLTNEVRATLERFHKNLTLLKIDDIDNVGSIKLRVRSLVESLKISHDKTQSRVKPFETTPAFTKAERKRTIIAPFFTPFLSPLIPAAMKVAGFNVVNLPMSDSESGELGLKYSNNEVCYPATLIVGDVIKAFKSGRFNPDDTAVAITQTGGQCRASNYIALIKRALLSNGYRNTPVVSLSFGSGIDNYQPGFKIPWLKLLPVALSTMLYSDVIAKMYYATVSREKEKGVAAKLKEKFLDIAKPVIERNNADALPELVRKAAKEFDDACTDIKTAKVGIVGEIFLEFNPYAQKNVTDWLIAQRLEVVPPLITDFFTQSFVNRETKNRSMLQRKSIPDVVVNWLYRKVQKRMDVFNDAASAFRYYTPFDDIFEKAKRASKIISLNAQFGEGWLIPGEISTYVAHGINHVVSLQPFGCIANHIIEKGIEKKLKTMFPELNILSLDFDSSVSDVNIVNRLLLFIDNVRQSR